MDHSGHKAFVVFNPKAGNAAQNENLRSVLAEHFAYPKWALEIYETTGEEDVTSVCGTACEHGATLVIAAGGDGTVVDVANALVHGQIPLGILPLGTGNDLARALMIPLELDKAVELLAGEHQVIQMDALKVGDNYYFSNVSVGISPHMMRDTKSEHKKRFGLLAYLWTMFRQSRIFQLRRYTLTIDGQKHRIRASEILISNTTLLDTPPAIFGPPETLKDSQLEVYLVTARTLGDYVRLLWDLLRRKGRSAAKLHHWAARRCIRIEADRSPQLVQGDGEVIGHTPVEIEIVPKALSVIMPLTEAST